MHEYNFVHTKTFQKYFRKLSSLKICTKQVKKVKIIYYIIKTQDKGQLRLNNDWRTTNNGLDWHEFGSKKTPSKSIRKEKDAETKPAYVR